MRFALWMALLAPVIVAACNRAPEPEPAPLLTAAEQACAGQAAVSAGVDPSTVIVTPTASTKSGATIYTATAGGMSYTCVVEVDMTVSEFSAL